MTVHKLSAGDGYTYLTRQVASDDQVRAAGQGLAAYYLAQGNPPGVWLGRGAEQLGLGSTVVTEAQMRALFGEGRHPDRDALLAAGAPVAATRLGSAFPTYATMAPYPQRVASALEAFEHQHGRPPSATERNQVAAKEAHRGRRAVAGYDLVFTPVKSASVLWALGGPDARRAVEDAHHEAVASAVGWVERHAAYTRTGHGGAAQIDARGLVCVAFDHRESRTGDPDLHTHVAVANKVCGADGRWRSLDARNLYALGVAASERYNTRFEDALTRRLGVVFEERPGGPPAARPVREVAGVPLELVRHFSRRRAAIQDRLAELDAEYRATHGREPNRATRLHLAQQATLETREARGAGRTLAEQVKDWTEQARAEVGAPALDRLLPDAVGRSEICAEPDEAELPALASRVVRRVAEQRSTWTVWNVHAETERLLRPLRFATMADRERVTDAVVAAATGPELTIRIAEPSLVLEAPALVRASDSESVFVAHGSHRYTTSEVLLAEDRLVAAGRTTDGPHLDPVVLDAALAIHETRTHVGLDDGQRRLVEAFALSPARLAVGIGPAGAGKTTAMRAFTTAWATASDATASDRGGRVVALATSAKAAQVLGDELGTRAENLHKFLFEHARPGGPADAWFELRAGDVVLVDESGMAGTLQLAHLLDVTVAAGASLRLLGDPAQLAAVDAGGALSLLEQELGAAHLTDLHRFSDPAEAAATLGLRRGDPAALGFYTERQRIDAGPRDAMLAAAYDAWASDLRAGRTSLLIAATTADVAALNARARAERVAHGHVEHLGVALRDGTTAGVGDWVVTRTNARHLRYRRGRWVQNGDTWRVVARDDAGALTVRHLATGGRVMLPAAYVGDCVELAYAATAHRVQGMTVDTAHVLVTAEVTRESLYVTSTRGRLRTHWYADTEAPVDGDCHHQSPAPQAVQEVLTGVLGRSGAESSATQVLRTTLEEATSLRTLVARYEHARSLAAADALRLASQTLAPAEARRILDDPAAPKLARTLAAAGRGADRGRLLRDVVALEPIDHVRSPALVVAARLADYGHAFGVPYGAPAEAPLPWLPGPDVGHPGWAAYLTARAQLIRDRADALGSLPAAYREQYSVPATYPTALGDPPEPGTTRATAYAIATAELTPPRVTEPARPTRNPEAPAPVRTPMSQQRGPRLSR